MAPRRAKTTAAALAEPQEAAAGSVTCAACIFHKDIDERSNSGGRSIFQCRRLPPPSPAQHVGEVTNWPRVYEDDWCGDFTGALEPATLG